MVDRFHHCIGADGDQTTRLNRRVLLLLAFPEPCKGKRAIIFHANVIRLLRGSFPSPFIKPIGEYETAAVGKGFAEGGFLGDRFPSGFNQLVPHASLLFHSSSYSPDASRCFRDFMEKRALMMTDSACFV